MKKKLFILIVLLISISCITVKAEENKTLINIDYPSTNQEVTNSLRIQGWVMSTKNTRMGNDKFCQYKHRSIYR